MRRKSYHEIDRIELIGSRIAARATSRLRSVLIAGFKQHKIVDITNDLFKFMFLPLLSASIVADLKGRRRSFRYADESFNVRELELELAFDDTIENIGSEAVRHARRVFKLPAKKLVKKALKVSVEVLPANEQHKKILDEIKKTSKQLYKSYESGKSVKKKIEKIPIQYVGKRSRIRPVPEPFKGKSRIGFREQLDREQKRVKEEIKEKIKFEKKYLYDEIVRHLRVIAKDVAVEAVVAVNWQEVYDRLTNDERNIGDIQTLIRSGSWEESQERLLTKITNKLKRKLRDKKERAKKELKEKAIKESVRAGREYVYKPLIKKPIVQKVSEAIFGEPRRSGSHRQYRSTYYYIAKSLQELEKGQRRRRQVETAKHILGSLGGIADLIGFLADYDIKDVFIFLSELGGASFFPETYKIGGIVKAANYIGEVGHTLELLDEDREVNAVREYQVKRTLRLIQELQTIRKLFARYHPPVFQILQGASKKVNDNLRQVINDLILSGASIPEGTKVLKEAFAANGLSVKEPFKIETIFRTQAALAYSAGRWQSDNSPAIQEILWGYKYITVGDSRVRPAHRVLDGVTLPKEDEFWLYFWPPNGWNCRCSVISLFEEREVVYPPSNWKGFAEIDQNFAFNAGEVFTEAPAHFAGTRG